ncbi:pepsinogen c precursor [Stylonychia lemnae]|uniref:Pepsinogen c n=1 Tax=Stylonychia lemnae TaxID=5949 RepID=A0A078A4U1_STYLE|nr:pepsinogen c precursor [Stylonychia lemnae]|eukprot:CDW75789.1 pepsinogen c precursor [Stylonychia lemnae]
MKRFTTIQASVLALFLTQQISCLKSSDQIQQTPKFLSDANTDNDAKIDKKFSIPLEKSVNRAQSRSEKNFGLRSQVKSIHRPIDGKGATVNLTNNYNFDYIGTFYVGNPPQPIRGCFDTGSANSWILSSECTTDSCKNGINQFFNPDNSPTFSNLHLRDEIMFGSGKLSGYFGEDDFRLGLGDYGITIHKQTIGLIIEEAILDKDYDAIIGLAYPKMASHGKPIMDSMIDQKLLDTNMFAFFMSMTTNEQSELTFGGYDEDRVDGEINWHPVADQLFWSLNLEDIKLNGQSLGICQDRKCLVTPDSGTSLMTAPSWAFEKLKKLLPYKEDCNDKTQFGVLTFVIDGKEYDIPSHHFMERYINVFEFGDQVCSTSMSTLNIEQDGQENLFIVGDSFMQIYYSIFDRDNDRVGLVRAKQTQREQQIAQIDWKAMNGQFKPQNEHEQR